LRSRRPADGRAAGNAPGARAETNSGEDQHEPANRRDRDRLVEKDRARGERERWDEIRDQSGVRRAGSVDDLEIEEVGNRKPTAPRATTDATACQLGTWCGSCATPSGNVVTEATTRVPTDVTIGGAFYRRAPAYRIDPA
jgi:hypothetical protein